LIEQERQRCDGKICVFQSFEEKEAEVAAGVVELGVGVEVGGSAAERSLDGHMSVKRCGWVWDEVNGLPPNHLGCGKRYEC